MILTTLTGISSLLYLFSSFSLVKSIQKSHLAKISIISAWIAALSHTGIIATKLYTQQGLDFSFFSIASFIALIIVIFLLLAALSKPVEKLGIILFPSAALFLLLNTLLPSNAAITQGLSAEMLIHIFSSITAFSLLAIAAVQALLLILQNYYLKNHISGKFVQSLAPLQAMEALLFQMIRSGLLFLSISLLTGFIFIDNLFAQHLVHKTILSLLAWIIFSCLLLGKRYYGWRGKTAISWTLYGFASLVLAYFGSKLVLEIILDKL
jgi:ABC-type uncharacterized transport system permease subunit